MKRIPSEFKDASGRQGSALITAVIFSFIIGALAVTFLKLATGEYRDSVRSTLYSSSLNLAESGVEMGVDALNSKSTSGSTWSHSVSDYLVDGAYSGDVQLVIFDADQDDPIIYAEGVISGHPAGLVRKQVRVELTTGFKPYRKGFATRNGITFNGNGVTFDSYNSNYGQYNALLDASAPFDYGVNGYNKNDDIYVASDKLNAVDGVSVDQGNATVYGYVAVSPNTTATIGPNGVVTSYSNGSHDPSRVFGDFYADFPDEAHPSETYNTSYSSINGGATVVALTPTYYNVSDISLSGSSVLTITGHVTLVLSGDISVSGQGGIAITPGSSLTIYTAGDVDIGGNGVANPGGAPSDFKIYGTASTVVNGDGTLSAGQTISISGNGQLASTIYAPAADVTLNGGGSSGQIFGGVVAFSATVTGGSAFHFDEALRDIVLGGGVYSVKSWLEMTGTTAASKPLDLASY